MRFFRRALRGAARGLSDDAPGRAATSIVLRGCLIGAAVIAVTALSALNARVRILTDAERELRNLAHVLANDANGTLRAAEATLDAVLLRASAAGALTTDAFAAWAGSAETEGYLRERTALLPALDAVLLIGADGAPLGSSRPLRAVRDDEPARRAGIGALAGGEAARNLGVPVPSSQTESLVLPLARRVSAADGGFLGAMVGVVGLDRFSGLHATLALRPRTSVLFFRGDGLLLSASGASTPAVARDFSRAPLFTVPSNRAGRGTVNAPGPDGALHLVAAHALPDYDALMLIVVPRAAVLEVWWSATWRLALNAILLLLVLTAAVLALRRMLRSETAIAAERLVLHKELETQHADFRATVDGMSQGVWKFGRDGRLAIANDRCAEVLGLPPAAQSPGTTLDDLIQQAGLSGVTGAQDILRRLERLVESGEAGAFLQDLPDGRAISVLHRPMADGGWLATFEDVTERNAAEARMRFLARHDALTGLPNRVQLQEQLSAALEGGSVHGGAGIAVLYLDLDRFKHVNDTLGHHLGDALLRAAAARIAASVRGARSGGDVVGRLGGDEFAVLLRTPAGRAEALRDDAAAVAARLVEVLAEPFTIDGHQVVVGATVGVAVHPTDGANPTELLRAADLALYRAKAEGRGRHRFFERAMDEEAQARRAVEAELRQALFDRGGQPFEIHFQPVVDIATGRPTGCEALLRWRRASHDRLVGPGEFVAIAEETDLILPLGELVLRRACAKAAQWADPGLRLAVNMSPAQFRRPGLVEAVSGALAASGLDPRRLEIEVTEGLLLERTEEALSTMHRLRALGVRFAMDDFGTGYSSLAYLRSFPFDRLKIDRSFVRDIEARPGDAAIVRSVAGMCAELGMTTVAEGVETQGQLAILAAARCREAQGYLFGHPVPARELDVVLARLSGTSAVAAE